MRKFMVTVRLQLARLEKMLTIINEFQKKEPEGFLKLHRKGDKTYYYHQFVNQSTKKIERKYLRKADMMLVKKLAQKQYYADLKKIIEKDIKLLTNFLEKYSPDRIEGIYKKLDIDRKGLIVPIPGSKEDIELKWKQEHQKIYDNCINIEQEEFYPEGKKYITEQGEYVRSKSEFIIANHLYKYTDDIRYIYEGHLSLKKDGRMITIHPDFTIMNVHTGRITYWEHAGKMDDLKYVEGFIRKMNLYAANDLLPGRDVIMTFETFENPLDISVVKKLVKLLCEGNPYS